VFGVPKDLCFLTERDGFLRAPRGTLGEVRSVLIRHGGKVEARSEVTWVERAPLPADAPRGDLGRPYQIEGENRLLGIHPGSSGVQGGIVLPCGAGKSWLGARAIHRSQQSAIVFVHTTDLLDQWAKTVLGATGRIPRIVQGDGVVYDPLRDREVAIAMVQTVHLAGNAANPLLRSAGVLLVDEAHRAPAVTYAEIIARCPARYRWWLSATPDREDGLGFVLTWTMGPVLLRRTAGQLAAEGYLVLPRVLPVRTGWTPDPYAHHTGHQTGNPRLDWTATSKGLAEDADRNALIVRLAKAAVSGGRTTLVLVSLVEHADTLASQLASAGLRAAPVTGEVGRKDRVDRLLKLREGILDVVVATSLADEGLDVPRLGCVILAAPQKTWGRSQQRIGRLTRPHPDKPGAGIAIDLVDGGALGSQYKRRARAYEEALGYPPEAWHTADDAVAALTRRPSTGPF
jgi:superfamily II DNA or RNA helicase